MQEKQDIQVAGEGEGEGAEKEPDRDETRVVVAKTTRATSAPLKTRPSQLRTTTRNNTAEDDITSSNRKKPNPNIDLDLPHLPYKIRDHKLSIAIYWTLVSVECCLIPISFYYDLSNGTSLHAGAIFAIITAVFGFVTGFKYAMRGWRLMQRSARYRPFNGARRFCGFDTVHWVIMVGTGVANVYSWRLRCFRMSWHVKGDVCPPLTFCILGDMVAVDGRGWEGLPGGCYG